MNSGGQSLRLLREQLGLTMRDVETASTRIAERRGNDEFAIPISRLSDMETKGVMPSIYRLYTLSVIYRQDMRELLAWFGIDFNDAASDLNVCQPAKSHISGTLASATKVQVPIKIDPGFDPQRTANLGRMIEQWGVVPLSYLAQFASCQYTYGYIGGEDLTMYPILPPGTFIQVDETLNTVVEGGWKSEYERPIYFVETRNGHTCCWCTMSREDVILQPHPLSPVSARVLRYPQEAEIIGQVVGVAMRLGEWRRLYDAAPTPAAREALN